MANIPSLQDQLQTLSPDYANSINDYANELKQQAQGNYDYITKYLKQAHTQALGTDNQAQAQFYEQVANNLESSIGRIPFDLDQATTREKQDYNNYLNRSAIAKQGYDTAQKQFTTSNANDTNQEQLQNKYDANSRGLLNSGIQQTAANKLALARKLNVEDPFAAQQTQERATLAQQDTEAGLQDQRNLADATTTARRAAQDANTTFNSGTDQAGLTLSNANKAADIQADQARQSAIGSLTAINAQNQAQQAYKTFLQGIGTS